jgi:hypothetical protein
LGELATKLTCMDFTMVSHISGQLCCLLSFTVLDASLMPTVAECCG